MTGSSSRDNDEPSEQSRFNFTGRAAIRAHRRSSLANWVPQQFTAVYGHNLQEYPAMSKNVTQQLIESHWVEGRMKPGEEIDL